MYKRMNPVFLHSLRTCAGNRVLKGRLTPTLLSHTQVSGRPPNDTPTWAACLNPAVESSSGEWCCPEAEPPYPRAKSCRPEA